MKTLPLIPALLLAWPLAAFAQTTPGPGDVTGGRPAQGRAAAPEQQVTEVTEELDPATGRVVKRTTRTFSAPAAAAEPAVQTPPAARPAAGSPAAPATRPGATPATRTAARPPRPGATDDPLVSDFLREGVNVAKLRAAELPDLYGRFIEKVRDERRQWKPANWENAAAVLSRLNARYEEVRQDLSLDERLSIRTNQAEFQTLRTARQVSDQVTNKL